MTEIKEPWLLPPSRIKLKRIVTARIIKINKESALVEFYDSEHFLVVAKIKLDRFRFKIKKDEYFHLVSYSKRRSQKTIMFDCWPLKEHWNKTLRKEAESLK